MVLLTLLFDWHFQFQLEWPLLQFHHYCHLFYYHLKCDEMLKCLVWYFHAQITWRLNQSSCPGLQDPLLKSFFPLTSVLYDITSRWSSLHYYIPQPAVCPVEFSFQNLCRKVHAISLLEAYQSEPQAIYTSASLQESNQSKDTWAKSVILIILQASSSSVGCKKLF